MRIHVERVIGRLRQKYSILSSTIPIDFVKTDESTTVTTLDKMVNVGCALIMSISGTFQLDNSVEEYYTESHDTHAYIYIYLCG